MEFMMNMQSVLLIYGQVFTHEYGWLLHSM